MSKYCIIGTGRQGTAALYDLILFSNATSILLIDSNQNSINNCLNIIGKPLLEKTKVKTKVINIDDKKKLHDASVKTRSARLGYNSEQVSL